MEIESPQQGTEELSEKKKKRGGSFRITRQAFEILMEYQATAWQIGAFLVLARYTDETGQFTTAGFKGIYEATGASPGTAKNPGIGRRVVACLLNMQKETDQGPGRLLYTPDEWNAVTGEPVPEAKHGLFPVSFVLNTFGSDDWIWFANELVDGFGRFGHPLNRLKNCGDVAARLLLIAYSMNNMWDFGGVDPSCGFYNSYPVYSHPFASSRFSFYVAVERGKWISETVTWQALRLNASEVDKEQLKPLENALISLVCQGFIYEIVTVLDRPPHEADSRPMYELHNRASKINKGEHGLVRRIDRVLSKGIGQSKIYYIGDATGRYHKQLPVISRHGVQPFVVGIYRLRFRINNPKNFTVKESWRRIESNRWEWEQDLDYLEKFFDLDPYQIKEEIFAELPAVRMTSEQCIEYNRLEAILDAVHDGVKQHFDSTDDELFDEIF